MALFIILLPNFYKSQEMSSCEIATLPKFAVEHFKAKVISISMYTEEGVQSHQAIFP